MRVAPPFIRLAAALIVCAAAGSAPAKPIGDGRVAFEATVVARADSTVLRGRVHRAPGRERRVQRTASGLRVVIIRHDIGVVWVLDPAARTYSQSPLSRAGPRLGVLDDRRFRLERDGEEAVSGMAATRYRYNGRTALGEALSGRLWLSEDGILVRIDGTSRRWGCCYRFSIRLSNLRRGPQDAFLFRVPRGYRRVAGPR